MIVGGGGPRVRHPLGSDLEDKSGPTELADRGRSLPRRIACSGATTDNLIGSSGHAGEPARLVALRRFASVGAVDMVTMTSGRNDLGFARTLTA